MDFFNTFNELPNDSFISIPSMQHMQQQPNQQGFVTNQPQQHGQQPLITNYINQSNNLRNNNDSFKMGLMMHMEQIQKSQSFLELPRLLQKEYLRRLKRDYEEKYCPENPNILHHANFRSGNFEIDEENKMDNDLASVILSPSVIDNNSLNDSPSPCGTSFPFNKVSIQRKVGCKIVNAPMTPYGNTIRHRSQFGRTPRVQSKERATCLDILSIPTNFFTFNNDTPRNIIQESDSESDTDLNETEDSDCDEKYVILQNIENSSNNDCITDTPSNSSNDYISEDYDNLGLSVQVNDIDTELNDIKKENNYDSYDILHHVIKPPNPAIQLENNNNNNNNNNNQQINQIQQIQYQQQIQQQMQMLQIQQQNQILHNQSQYFYQQYPPFNVQQQQPNHNQDHNEWNQLQLQFIQLRLQSIQQQLNHQQKQPPQQPCFPSNYYHNNYYQQSYNPVA